MKYYKSFYGEEERIPISYYSALSLCLGTFRDNDMTRDMLSIPNRINCSFSLLTVESDDGLVAAPGLYNILPINAVYDDDGNRIN